MLLHPRGGHHLVRILPLAGVALLLCGPGCGRAGKAPEEAGYEFQKNYTSGGLTLTMKVSRLEITVADRIDVVLEALAEEGTEVELPAPGGKMGEFMVASVEAPASRLAARNRVSIRSRYELEPYLAGDYEIPSLEIRFGGGRPIRTEPVRIRVASVLPPGEEALEIREIAPPVELPGLGQWIHILIGVALASLGYSLYQLWRRRKVRRRAARGLAPHERALWDLTSLMEKDLIGQGRQKLFYLRVSAILRYYIEERFGLRAPERTTEEFLADLRTSQDLLPRQKELLKQFLEHCDMVKFAEHQPSREEIDETINTCAQFIAETRPGQRAR